VSVNTFVFALSTDLFLLASVLCKDQTTYGQALALFHNATEFSTSFAAIGAYIGSEMTNGVLLISTSIFVLEFVYLLKLKTLKEGLTFAYYSSLLMHYPMTLVLLVAAIYCSLFSNDHAYVL
jgi:hypothetical protein